MKANDFLTQACEEMRNRSVTYDRPSGERSMGRTVEAFEAVTGVRVTETQGWLFMALLKAVRSQQGAYREDSFVDGAAYFALAGETASAADTQAKLNAILGITQEEDEAWDEKRIDIVGSNGNDGLHYCDHTAGLHSYPSTKEAQCIDCKAILPGGDEAKLTTHKRVSSGMVGPDT